MVKNVSASKCDNNKSSFLFLQLPPLLLQLTLLQLPPLLVVLLQFLLHLWFSAVICA